MFAVNLFSFSTPSSISVKIASAFTTNSIFSFLLPRFFISSFDFSKSELFSLINEFILEVDLSIISNPLTSFKSFALSPGVLEMKKWGSC